MVFKDKEAFYKEIEFDYEQKGEESFIFKYIKNQKEDKVSPEVYLQNVNRTRKDAYINLLSCYEAYKEKQITASELKPLLLKDMGRLSRDEMAGVLGISSDDPILKELKKKDLIDNIKKVIDKELVNGKLRKDSAIDQLVPLIGSIYLKEDVYDYLYNALGGKCGSGGGRRNDESLDMMIQFQNENYKATEDTETAADKLADDNYLKDCKELYKYINGLDDESGSYVFIPLMIDRDTGLGLYMIGSEYLFDEDHDYKKNKKENCYYCIMRFDDPDPSFGTVGDFDYAGTGDSGNIDKNKFKMAYRIETGGALITKLDDAISLYGMTKKKCLDYDGYGGANENIADEISECVSVNRFKRYFEKIEEIEPREDEENRKLEDELKEGQTRVLEKFTRIKTAGLE